MPTLPFSHRKKSRLQWKPVERLARSSLYLPPNHSSLINHPLVVLGNSDRTPTLTPSSSEARWDCLPSSQHHRVFLFEAADLHHSTPHNLHIRLHISSLAHIVTAMVMSFIKLGIQAEEREAVTLTVTLTEMKTNRMMTPNLLILAPHLYNHLGISLT